MLIAEIGLNHLGQSENLINYIDKLIETDVDAVTLQVREPEFYDEKWGGHPAGFFNLELHKDNYFYVKEKIRASGKKFGIAIGDINYINFFESLNVDFYKVIRNDITDFKLIDKLIETKKEVIVSTGLSSNIEISKFVNYIGDNKNFKLNHTQLSYDIEDCNLNAIKNMKQNYGLEVSFGNHCKDINVLYMALCYNPSDILFYVKHIENVPDSEHAIHLSKVNEVVNNINNFKKALGTGIKKTSINKMEETPYEKSERLKNEDADGWDNTLWG